MSKDQQNYVFFYFDILKIKMPNPRITKRNLRYFFIKNVIMMKNRKIDIQHQYFI